jgi:hypothetical protein
VRAGAAGDDHVRVLGAESSPVGEAALERGEGERVERNPVRPATEPRRSRCGVDVGDGERAQLADRCAVQQREQSDKRLVRVAVPAGPAAQQLCLVAPGEGTAAEPAGGAVSETCCWIGEADPLLAGEAEEVTERREPEPPVAARGKERLDVGARARRPIAHALLVEVHGELGDDREALLDRVVFERVLADPPGALATGQQPGEISLGRGAQRRGAALDPARASAVSEPAALVAGEHEATSNEERLQQPGGVARAAAGAAAVEDRGDHRGWPVSPRAQRPFQATQVPHADRWGAALQQPVGERAEPFRAAFGQTIVGALDPHADD